MNKETPEEMIKTKIVEAGNVAKTINRETNQGQHAAVAVGRTGAAQEYHPLARPRLSIRSCHSWASMESVAIGRASRRLNPISSPVCSQ